MEKSFGIGIIPPKGRNYQIEHEIIDKDKFTKFFPSPIKLISIKPKDMIQMMVKRVIQYGINYSNSISSF